MKDYKLSFTESFFSMIRTKEERLESCCKISTLYFHQFTWYNFRIHRRSMLPISTLSKRICTKIKTAIPSFVPNLKFQTKKQKARMEHIMAIVNQSLFRKKKKWTSK